MDGLRGIAALVVVAHHIEQDILGGANRFSHGYLAVDFFFLLSGFVVARAYEVKLADRLTIAAYLVVRLKRLYPVLTIGIVLGFYVAMAGGNPASHPVVRLGAQLAFIPTFWFTGTLFRLNSVEWSLVVEITVNMLHASLLRWLSIPALSVLVTVLAAALFVTAHRNGGLSVGWASGNFYGGFVRGGFGFFLGVLFFRLHTSGRLPVMRVPWPLVASALPVLVIVASLYRVGFRWYADPLLVVFGMPTLLLAGLSRPVSGRVSTAAVALGALSYPIYAVQEPLIFAVRAVLSDQWHVPGSMVAGCAVLAILAVSYALIPVDAAVQRTISARRPLKV